MFAKDIKLWGIATTTGLLLCVVYLLAPQQMQHYILPLAISLIVGFGIPHGAADIALLKHLNLSRWSKLRYFEWYLLLCGIYALLWWASATIALLLFIFLSVYHFGQSNWQALFKSNTVSNGPPVLFKVASYVLWGSFAVFTPLLFHYAETATIVEQIIASPLSYFSASVLVPCAFVLLLMNGLIVFWASLKNYITRQNAWMEILNLGVLCLLFYTLPLLLGFSLYFVFWHSISSIQDQIHFFRRVKGSFSWKHYILTALPFTLLAIIGLLAWYGLHLYTGWAEGNIGLLFSFIAIITLPHTVVMEFLYKGE
ncbi:MAG: Brp/Blh family beta-carotene 15,15'-dioxygenase [Bacteroidota bacterium]